jgi:predicted AAA+ superfamily ATPase
MFCVTDRQIVPVKSPDTVRLSDLKGYEAERQAVIDNTVALLNGKPAANALLYGDAGTGKSSTVKAVVNEFAGRGLRLVEIRKNQLMQIPAVIESLHQNPLKFILFIDDLSFARSNEEIGALKAVLEGSAAAKSSNIVLYATSNRRHLIHETFSERGDDDIHRNETMQEQLSLSDRFGLSVNFFKPDKEKYLAIVNALAKQYGVSEAADLDLNAERYALERGGRSPRADRQFIEYLMSL